jgi:hypothetical protein
MKSLFTKIFALLGSLFSSDAKKITEGWKPIDKNTIKETEFTLQGQEINYKNGRPYVLYLKQENGKSVWYAEMQDTAEWFITKIGQ